MYITLPPWPHFRLFILCLRFQIFPPSSPFYLSSSKTSSCFHFIPHFLLSLNQIHSSFLMHHLPRNLRLHSNHHLPCLQPQFWAVHFAP